MPRRPSIPHPSIYTFIRGSRKTPYFFWGGGSQSNTPKTCCPCQKKTKLPLPETKNPLVQKPQHVSRGKRNVSRDSWARASSSHHSSMACCRNSWRAWFEPRGGEKKRRPGKKREEKMNKNCTRACACVCVRVGPSEKQLVGLTTGELHMVRSRLPVRPAPSKVDSNRHTHTQMA